MFDIDLEAHWSGSISSTTTLRFGFIWRRQQISRKLPQALLTKTVLTWQGQIHVLIHSIWRMWNTWYVFEIDVGSHLNGSIVSTTTLCCGLTLRRQTGFWATSKSLADGSSGNMVRTDTYAHPQHMKDVKHIICVWDWCGSPIEWVYSLSNRTMLWFDYCGVSKIPGNFHLPPWLMRAAAAL
jgi:hypothetical protein